MTCISTIRWIVAGVSCLAGISGTAHANPLLDLLSGNDPRSRHERTMRELDERCKRLIDWAGSARMTGPVPSPQPIANARDARRVTASGSKALQGGTPGQHPMLSLFADAVFKPAFGRSFDELSPSQRLTIHSDVFVGCQRSPTYGGAAQRIAGTLGAPFADVGSAARPGTLNATQVTDWLQRSRAAPDEVQTMLREMQALPSDASSWPVYVDGRVRLQASIDLLAPVDAAAAAETLRTTGQRLAAPAAAAALAQASGDDDPARALPALQRAHQALDSIAAAAPGADLQAMRTQLDQRRGQVIRAALAQERSRVEALPATAAGLEAGAAWYSELQRRYGADGLRGEADFAALLREFRLRRDRQLADAQPAWEHQLRQARSADDVNRVVARALPLPDDAQSSAGLALRQAARSRQDELYKTQVLGAQAQAPRPARGVPTQTAPPAPRAEMSANAEPTAAEMYDVLQAKFNGIARTMRDMNNQCQRGGARTTNPADAITCLGVMAGGAGGMGEAMRITRFEKLGCAPASGRPGWTCDYVLGVGGGGTAAMGSMMGQLMGRGGISSARFLRTSSGWVAIFNEKS